MPHYSLHRSLLIESRHLRHRGLSILRPMPVDRVLSGSLFTLSILAALPILLIWANLNGVRPAIDLLLRLVLLIGATHVLSNNERILVEGRICTHCQALTSLAGCQFPIVVVLITDVTEG